MNRFLFDGEGGEGGGGGAAEDVVTIPKKEYEERMSKQFSNGMSEGRKRASASEVERFSKRNINLIDNDIDKTLDSFLETLANAGKGQTDKEKDYEAKIKGLSDEVAKHAKIAQDSQLDRDNYIVRSEIMKAISDKVVNPSDAIDIFLNNYKVERLKSGEVKAYYVNGQTVYNKLSDPATLPEVIEEFLSKREYLMKSQIRGGGNGAEEKTGLDANLNKLDPLKMTPEQRKQFKEQAKQLPIGN